jgi:hypothetical protein
MEHASALPTAADRATLGQASAASMNRTLLCILLVALPTYAEADTPRQFAERFYRNYFRWQIRGVPTVEERNRISVFFSSEILRLYAAADRQRTKFERRFPFDPKHPELALKPPWCKEGDPFSDSYEGVSTFAIGLAIPIHGKIEVQAHLEYVIGTKVYPWTDTLVLDRAGGEWVVSDIRFAGGHSLVADMREGLRETERELSQYYK